MKEESGNGGDKDIGSTMIKMQAETGKENVWGG